MEDRIIWIKSGLKAKGMEKDVSWVGEGGDSLRGNE
jgi:hypothetical protein